MTKLCAAGVDVGRDYLDVAIEPTGLSFRRRNQADGIDAIVAKLRAEGVARVVIESIGCYAARLIRALAEAGMAVAIVDPKRIQAMRRMEGKLAKTDRLDAKLIARFAVQMRDAVRPVPSPQALQIRALSTRRRQVVEMIAMEKTRLKQTIDEPVADSCRAMIAMLSAERARIEAELQSRIALEPGRRRGGELLQTIPGVGPAVSMTLMADLPELGLLDRRAVASLAGLAPHPNDSGLRTGHGHIQGGRPCVRTALYMAAISAVRCENGFKREYKALRAAGKPAKVALIAIARKIVVAANSMLKADRPWTAHNA